MSSFAPIQNCDLLLIAGEASGDEHAGALVKKILAARPNLKIAALGGRCLHEAGATLIEELTAYSAVGLWEVIKKLPKFLELLDKTVRWIAENKPRRVIFVDFPGFNLELAKRLFDKKISKKSGGLRGPTPCPLPAGEEDVEGAQPPVARGHADRLVELYFYISPQIWAWKKHRRFTMAKYLDALGVIFPFEVEHFADTTLKTEFVGHPFVDVEFQNPFVYDPAGAIVLLPGSRRAIVAKHLPVLWQAYRQYAGNPSDANLDAKAAGCYASEAQRQQMIAITDSELPLYPAGTPLRASAVLCTAGTISLLTALAGIPSALIYKTDPLTYLVGKNIYKVGFLGMPNIFLKREIVREFIQPEATAEKLAAELERLRTDLPAKLAAQKNALELKTLLMQTPHREVASWATEGL